MNSRGSRSVLHNSKERRNQDIRFIKRDAVIHDQRIDSLWKAAQLQMGQWDDERSKLLREQSFLEQKQTRQKEKIEETIDENEKGPFPKELDGQSSTVDPIREYRKLHLTKIEDDSNKSRKAFTSWSTVFLKKKDETKTLIKPKGTPMSKDKLNQLSRPITSSRSMTCSDIFLRNRDRVRSVTGPRSICQLRSLPSQEYDKLMGRRPKTAIKNVDQPTPISETIHSTRQIGRRSKNNSSTFRALTREHKSVTSPGLSVEELSACRYLYTYRADTPLDISQLLTRT